MATAGSQTPSQLVISDVSTYGGEHDVDDSGTDEDAPTIDVINPMYVSHALLACTFIALFAYWVFQCTPILDMMIEEPAAKRWVGVTPAIEWLCNFMLIFAMLNCVYIWVHLTCWWKKTVQIASAKDEANKVARARCLCWGLYRSTVYLRRPTSARSIIFMFVWECKEFIAQALVVDQMSQNGISRVPLALITSVILINGLVTPWALVIITNRFNDPTNTKSHANMGKYMSRLLLFDATCDVLYSFFALGHLLYRYFAVMHAPQTEVRAFAEGYMDPNDVLSLLLMGEAQQAFFGGNSAFEVFLQKCLIPAYPIFHEFGSNQSCL
eukprot:g5091.t1